MLGAIIGDIAGSRYEFENIKTKEFPLLSEKCRFTDDTVMTVAIAAALLKYSGDVKEFKNECIAQMQKFGREYPFAGYGGMFRNWLFTSYPQPYNSFGNGSAMRVSPVGFFAETLDEAERLAAASAEVTHDHPEGVRGAKATAAAVFLARSGKSKKEIKQYLKDNFYALDFTLDEIRSTYRFDVTCQGSVPQAITAFLESEGFEDAIRNAVSIGGDSDTIACIAGGIAEAYYGIPKEIELQFSKLISNESFYAVVTEFETVCKKPRNKR